MSRVRVRPKLKRRQPLIRPRTPAPDARLTAEARALLAQADAGGVPAFITQNLRRIAVENGVTVSPDMTPNAILDALRAQA